MKKMFRTLAVLMLCLSFLVSCVGKKETISKFDENGRYIPSIVILKRIADGLNMRMSIEFLEEEEI